MFVLDASAAVSWAFADEKDARSAAAWDRLGAQSAAVPYLWWFEVRNSLIVNERRGRIAKARTDAFLEMIAGAPIDVFPVPADAAICGLARRWKLTIYDAAYLELAQRLDAPLATLDRKLAESARAAGVGLI